MKKLLAILTAAPLWGLVILVFCITFGIIKHATGWPPFLSQLGIFAVGLALGLVTAAYGLYNDLKPGIILKKSNELNPDPALWYQVSSPVTDPGRYFSGKENPALALWVVNGRWYFSRPGGAPELLGVAKTEAELNDLIKWKVLK